jgi:hypothetical protein
MAAFGGGVGLRNWSYFLAGMILYVIGWVLLPWQPTFSRE